MGGSKQSAIAIAPKSVTMPIAIEVTDKLDGVMGITAVPYSSQVWWDR